MTFSLVVPTLKNQHRQEQTIDDSHKIDLCLLNDGFLVLLLRLLRPLNAMPDLEIFYPSAVTIRHSSRLLSFVRERKRMTAMNRVSFLENKWVSRLVDLTIS